MRVTSSLSPSFPLFRVVPPFITASLSLARDSERGRNLGADFSGRLSLRPLLSSLSLFLSLSLSLSCFTAMRARVNSHSLRVYIIIKARLHGRRRRRCEPLPPSPPSWNFNPRFRAATSKNAAINLKIAIALAYLISS